MPTTSPPPPPSFAHLCSPVPLFPRPFGPNNSLENRRMSCSCIIPVVVGLISSFSAVQRGHRCAVIFALLYSQYNNFANHR